MHSARLYLLAFDGGLVKFGRSRGVATRARALNDSGMLMVCRIQSPRIDFKWSVAECDLLSRARAKFGAPICGKEWFVCPEWHVALDLLRCVYARWGEHERGWGYFITRKLREETLQPAKADV